MNVRMVLASLLLAACAAGPPSDDAGDVEQQDDAIVEGTPDGRQIAGKLTRAVALTAAPGGARHCTLPVGDVLVAKYEKGHYRVYLPGRRPCNAAAADSFRGWVPADALAIEDTAYFGKLKRVAPSAWIDVSMSYAGKDIFCTGGRCLIDEALYGMNRCYLHPRTAAAIESAGLILQSRLPGAKLALLDCYRPIYVQQRMASLVANPTWVAQPSPPRYGGHNGGIAVDLTLEGVDGALLDMGSGFDEFSNRSKFAFTGLTAVQSANRKVLREVMISVGLKPYDAEWWHFSLDIRAEPLDLAL